MAIIDCLLGVNKADDDLGMSRYVLQERLGGKVADYKTCFVKLDAVKHTCNKLTLLLLVLLLSIQTMRSMEEAGVYISQKARHSKLYLRKVAHCYCR